MMPESSPFEASRQHLVDVDRSGSSYGVTPSRRAILWVIGLAVAAFCFYRLATFTPQPLDSASTLRPVLNRWFLAFIKLYSQPEQALASWRAICFVLLVIPALLAMLNFLREQRIVQLPHRVVSIFCSFPILFASIALAMIACRYPTFLIYQLNPDEAEFLSAAHKLFWDGNFFRAVDTGTSGPLNNYALMLPAIFGFSPDFASSRVLILIFALCDIYLLYRTVRLLATDSVARIAIIPIAAAFAVFRDATFLHYSSEQTPLLIVATALFTSVSVLARPATHTRLILVLGLLASVAFFTKMQSVPIVVAMAAVAIAYTHVTGNARRFWRPSALFAAGALPLIALNALLCWLGGVWGDFWMSYIVSNQRYTETQTDFLRDLPRFVEFVVGPSEVRLFLLAFLALGVSFVIESMYSKQESQKSVFIRLCLASAIVIAAVNGLHSLEAAAIRGYLGVFALATVAIYALFYRPRSFGADPVRWFGLLSILTIAAALYSVYKPHRPFPHYLLFLYFPVFTAMAWMLIRHVCSAKTNPRAEGSYTLRPDAPLAFVLLFLVLTVSGATSIWASQPNQEFENVVATVRPPEGDFIRSVTSPDGQITVWGWTADPYLGSGRVAATRDLNILYFFAASPEVSSFYRARFMHDIRENPPELFIDAVGPTSWSYWDRGVFDFRQFPDVTSFVTKNYVHFADGYGQQYYLRRDLAAKKSSSALPRNCSTQALRCVDVPLRNYAGDGSMLDVTKSLEHIGMPSHALIEMQFTPAGVQTDNATVFNNEAVPHSYRGFRFQSIGDDRYQLILGQGTRWAFSKPLLLPPGKMASVSIEMKESYVQIRVNGNTVEEMHMASPMFDAPGPITLGSWIGGYCRFWGTIQFFQIMDLTKNAAEGI